MTEPGYLTETRTAYDTVAVDYAARLAGDLAANPFDRAVLGVFAELVLADGGGLVADLGCGPGRIAGHLSSLGLTTLGVDLSPAMITVARQTYPHLRFREGILSDLQLADGRLAGAVAWYSIIHTPPPEQPIAFAQFHRVIRPGGHLLLAFQVGDDQPRHIRQAYGHTVSAQAFRPSPDRVREQLGRAGFVEVATLLREPREELENSPQAYLLVRKPGPIGST